MPEPATTPANSLDAALGAIENLTWLPWVGHDYAALQEGRKVLVVAESHYTPEQDPEVAKRRIVEYEADPFHTRSIVKETLVDLEWTTPTLSNLHRLFFSPEDRDAFWGQLCYHNIIQRVLWYREGGAERPAWEDFWDGWDSLIEVIQVLQPDHILFIGVEAANHFNGFSSDRGIDFSEVEWREKVGSAYARAAEIRLDGKSYPLHFIKHCGSYFSSERWSEYLVRHAPSMMASIAESAGAGLPKVVEKRLHVLGMAKSCLDLVGAKGPKLELDFLRLAYAVRDFLEAGENAIGYLLVLEESVAKRAAVWIEKYNTGDAVRVLFVPPETDELALLRSEKESNALGMTPGQSSVLAVADSGKEIGERLLESAVHERHPGLQPSTDLPLRVRWDFYGTTDAATA